MACRFCHEEQSDPSNPLISPCACSGSVQQVHTDCLEQWVATSNSITCNMCNQQYAQTIEYNGRLPRTLVETLVSQEQLYSSLVLLFILILTSTTLTGAGYRVWRDFFIDSSFTFTKLALYNASNVGLYTLVGFGIGILRQVTFTIGTYALRIEGSNLIAPTSLLLSLLEFLVARHHITFTGWIWPVIIMYYHSVYRLIVTLLFDNVLAWYRRQYFKRRFIDTRT